MRRLTSILWPCSLWLLAACATGADDEGGGGPSVFSGGPADDPYGEETEGEETEDDPPPPPGDSVGGTGPDPSGGEDDGNPLCCEVHPDAGCDSATTESCVCASRPECCQQVWTQDCVDLAIACGDPYCEGDPADPPPDDPPDDPPPDEPPPDDPPPPPPPDGPPYMDCPCIQQADVDNFCHYGPSYPGCPMTAPGGYCDPDGNADFNDGDWVRGYNEWHVQCA